jgi:hypothetical protein
VSAVNPSQRHKEAIPCARSGPADQQIAQRCATQPMTDAPPKWPLSLVRSPVEWTSTTYWALLSLVVLWAALFSYTWASWGNLTIDCGREMYVPAALLKGNVLYRDVWYLYGPLAPYFNSLLFRVFGVHLKVLYWAGSISALLSGIFLYLTGMRLGSWPAGLGAAAIVQSQAFESSLMCFPLPYSFASVYGCLISCLFLWLIVRCIESISWMWMFFLGIAAALALLLKPEFGAVCYVTLAMFIAVRALRWGWTSLGRDCGAALPGVVASLAVIGWMLSISGVRFITQENIMSWPTSYFMKQYGKQWLAISGSTVTPRIVGVEALWTIVLLVAVFVANLLLQRVKSDRSYFFVLGPVAIITVACAIRTLPWARLASGAILDVLLPKQLVCLVLAAAAILWVRILRGHSQARDSALALAFTFSSLLAFRILFLLTPSGYAIYYDGPAVLSFLLLASTAIPRSGRSPLFVTRSESLIVVAIVTAVMLHSSFFAYQLANRVPLSTEAGMVKVSKPMSESYAVAIEWIKGAKARGQAVLSVPEDTSLYFLSGIDCPTRVIEFTPGVVAPGHMADELIAEIETKRIPYLLWSNREYPEYGTPVFGTDYDRDLGDYFRSHYRPLRALTDLKTPLWNAVIWERISDREAR